MCIRDRARELDDESQEPDIEAAVRSIGEQLRLLDLRSLFTCLLYTSDAADERSSVDLGGRRIIKKKNMLATSERALG